jgi:hypothetical protein
LKTKNGTGKEKNFDTLDQGGILLFEGEFFKGKRWNGKGKEYDFNDKLIFKGIYLNGEKIKGKQCSII